MNLCEQKIEYCELFLDTSLFLSERRIFPDNKLRKSLHLQ